LVTLPNGEYTLVDASNTSYSATANVTCDPGHDPNVTSVTCMASGNWEEAECRIKGVLLFQLYHCI